MNADSLISTARNMHAAALSVGSTGNLSRRAAQGMLISASGSSLANLNPSQVVYIDLDGRGAPGQARASSEWALHAAIYRERPDVSAVVHCHSRYATALACCRRGIPSFHYMVEALGGAIGCADYALFGTDTLAASVMPALGSRQACLLANHGQIAVGATLEEALERALLVEELAAQYWATLAIGGPVLLSPEEMQDVVERFKDYGAGANAGDV